MSLSMPMYKYTLIKYAKAKSTWFIVLLGILLGGVVGGVVPWEVWFKAKGNNTDGVHYMEVAGVVVTAITSFLVIFSAIFAGFKGATMFKDEVENGVFLTLLSKPMKRSTIITQKWLALQSINLLFTLLSTGSYAIFTVALDKGSHVFHYGSTLAENMGMIFVIMSAIVFLGTVLFSSIALMISTRLSSAATIGITIAIGTIIPITSMVSMFMKGNNYQRAASSEAANIYGATQMLRPDFVDAESAIKLLQPSINSLLSQNVDMVTKVENIYQKISNLEKVWTNQDYGISNLMISKKENSNPFKYGYIFDLNYQISQMASIPLDQVIPSQFSEIVQKHSGAMSTSYQVPNDSSNMPNQFSKEIKDRQASSAGMIDTLEKNLMPLISLEEDIHVAHSLIETALKTDVVKHNDSARKELEGVKSKLSKFYFSYQNIFDFAIDSSINNLFKTTPYHFIIDDITNKESKRFDLHVLPNLTDETKNKFNNLEQTIISHLNDQVNEQIARDKIEFASEPEVLKRKIESQENKLKDGTKNIRKELRTLTTMSYYEPGKIIHTKVISYSNKYTILGLYALLAFALVPVSYLIIRRKDFR